ncbi:MAG: TolC family protein [Sedimentisphaerales bacterium]|nr:TolC family protein [Sedimentisphaerales bacterium]
MQRTQNTKQKTEGKRHKTNLQFTNFGCESIVFSLWSIFVFLLFPSGCGSKKMEKLNEDASLSAYQKKLTNYEARRGTECEDPNYLLDILRPAASNDSLLPEITIITDPETGKKIVKLTVEEVVQKTLANSPEIRVVSFDPSISKLDVTKAVSEFDITAFGNLNYQKDDNPRNSIYQSGQSNERSIDTGVKQKLTTGSEWSLTYAFTRAWDDLAGRTFSSRYEPILSFQLRQPLMRDAWKDLNLAGVDIAKLNYKIAMLSFRQQAEDITTQVISSYWQLVQDRRNIDIYRELLKQTEDTLAKVQGRRQIDATDVQIQQAQAYVKSRQAALIQAEKQLLDQQDAILRFMSDSHLSMMDEVDIVPASALSLEKTSYDIKKLLETAIRKNPVIQQARVGIDIADINIRIAKNQKMPRLDFVTSLRTQNLDESPEDAYARFYNGDYVSYGAGLSLEYPLGNRKSEAELMKRRLERRQAAVKLENITDQAAQLTKEKARRIETDFAEIEKQRAAAEAARLHLQVLEESEIIRERLTPEFMLLKLQAQEFLANSQIAEIRAIVDYNIAIAELSRLMGTVLELYMVEPNEPEQPEPAESDNTGNELFPIEMN